MANASNLLTIDHARTYHGVQLNAFNSAQEVGFFSLDADKNIHFDRSQMKYYVPRRGYYLHLDLNVGYENVLRKQYDCSESMENLLKWIQYQRFDPLSRYNVNFVASRGTLKELLCTPYTPSSPWIICACRLDDIIYIENIDSDAKIQQYKNRTDREKRMGSWGYKFEQYMTADKPGGVPDISSNTHEIEEFCLMVTNKIGPHKILIRAETDGVDTRGTVRAGSGDTSCYVEMKTSKTYPDFRRSYQFKHFKALSWWAQSVVIGIDETICGLRDEVGIVQTIEELKTSDLPILCQDVWNPTVCFQFCNNFLDYLQKTLKENDHRVVYKFEYLGGSRVSVTRLQNPEERYRVIPDWYFASCKNKQKMQRSGE